MKTLPRLTLLAAAVLLASCAATPRHGTIAQLRDVKLDLADERIEGGIEKAMAGYQKFLAESPESAMTPEAIRRLADLKLEREYGQLERAGRASAAATALAAPERAALAPATAAAIPSAAAGAARESARDFERRATAAGPVAATAAAAGVAGAGSALPGEAGADLQNANAEEAIVLYRQLLEKYPQYARNDQVLYQMSRAYEELGRVDEAMAAMTRIVTEFPGSRFSDEIQFRRGEYFFTRRKYLEAEGAYQAIVKSGEHSAYYELALYKLGWTYYKQDMHEEALQQFTGLLDFKIKSGYDFAATHEELERKRVEDTYRVISLSFSALGGADAVVAYFDRHGRRSYEVDVYRNLGEHYLDKRRYADAAAAYKAFVRQNPFHQVAPHFDMRVIEIYKQGDFPQLVIEANKDYATRYGLKAEYWKHFAIASYPEVVGYLKANIKELANHYHALYQDKERAKDRPANFAEASHWYREYLDSFPKEEGSAAMNYQLADLLLENRDFGASAQEYERTAYDYPAHEKAAAAGYAAVYAYREQLGVAAEAERDPVRREVIRSSLRFADAWPAHEKAALVMGGALEDIFGMKDYAFAVTTGRKLITVFPTAEPGLRRGAWLIVADSSYQLAQYHDAEEGYGAVLQLTAADDKSRPELVENLAAAIYKQGEQANAAGDFRAAAEHFLRVGRAAPTAKIRPAADYDAAAAYIQLKAWPEAATVLLAFRKDYPGHKLQPDVTRKLALVYQEDSQFALAAAEYERIETETKDEGVRREALQMAAGLYLKATTPDKALLVYRRFLDYFPRPVEPVVETRHKIAEILLARNDQPGYLKELRQIVDADARAGKERTDRTRYLGATSALVLTEPLYAQFAAIPLSQPFDKSLKKKKAAMKAANEAFGKLVDYEVGDVTAAATYYIAEAYYAFSDALKKSERPKGMDELEAEQYEEALDEQAYPFEEKAIAIHQKNIDLVPHGIYNAWIDKSLGRLAVLMPGRYAKPEESTGYIAAIDTVDYHALVEPKPVVVAAPAASAGPAAGATPPAAGGEAVPAGDGTPESSAPAPAVPSAPAGSSQPAPPLTAPATTAAHAAPTARTGS